jgi:hypothetical protein
VYQANDYDILQFPELPDIRQFCEENGSDSEDVEGGGKLFY